MTSHSQFSISGETANQASMSCWLHYEAQLVEYIKSLAFHTHFPKNWNPINLFNFFFSFVDSWRNSIHTHGWDSTHALFTWIDQFQSVQTLMITIQFYCCACRECAHFGTVLLWLYAVIITSLASKQITLFTEKWSNAIIDNCLKFIFFLLLLLSFFKPVKGLWKFN